jgi:S-adenosyl methyltransferase
MTAPGRMAGPPDGTIPPRLDINVAHQSRIYNYLLGGKDNFAVDREAAERALEAFPGLAAWARNNRAFLARAVRYLVSEAGIRQFLDLGTGLPSAENTHEVAQRIVPTARICYVDNDPVVLTHARALLSSDPAGVTGYVDADIRDSERVLGEAAKILDFTQPTAVMLLAILHVIPDEDDPWQVAAQYMAAMPPGSFLVISHPARDIHASQVSELTKRFNERLGGVQSRGRTRDEMARFFTGLDLVPPGIVVTPQWRPDPDSPAKDADPAYAAVARKP